jgi:two-component system, chemotaxis family, response regulator Rcp1
MEARPGRDILLVEDSASDVFLTQEAFKEVGPPVNLHVVSDGVEALSYLRREGPYQTAPRPNLVLLDLNMPRKDGRDVLAEVKNDEALKDIPVVVLTTSSAEADLRKSYSLHANCYITKSTDFKRFKEAIRMLAVFWFETVSLPPQ